MRRELRDTVRKLRTSEREWEVIFNTIQEEVYLVSRDFSVLRANQAAARRLGEPVEALVGKPCCQICPAGERFVAGECPGLMVLTGGASPTVEVKDSRTGRTLAFSVYPIRAEPGRPQAHVEVLQDVTSLKQAEIEASKRETSRLLGEMAAGVAHDLNNLLAIVVGYTEKALAHARELPEVRAALETVERAALVGGETVRRIATFARVQQHHGHRLPSTLNTLVEECVTLARHKFQDEALRTGRVIEVVTRLEPVGAVSANAAELKEVFLNLIFNAVDAMPAAGTLSLRTFREGGSAMVEVTDTGVGMSDEVQARAFDPFFTTKGDRGTGLGLSIVRTIVDQHGGQVSLESLPGRGTTVRIRLPVTQEAVPAETPPLVSFGLPAFILVVDDQEEVRGLLREILSNDGHTVLETGTGSEALRLLERAAFDLVVTDLAMPGLSGLELIRAIRALRPEMPAVLVTGYADLLDPESSALPTHVIRKPFGADEIRHAVRSALSRGEPKALKLLPLRTDR